MTTSCEVLEVLQSRALAMLTLPTTRFGKRITGSAKLTLAPGALNHTRHQ
jgi:hypothetical protein